MSTRKIQQQVNFLVEVINKVPGAIDVFETQGRRLAKLHDEYRKGHWGQPGTRPAAELSIPDPWSEGVWELGELYAVAYLTRKGRAKNAEVYEHMFKRPLPILGVAADGSGLVVVRGASRYTVNERGIVG